MADDRPLGRGLYLSLLHANFLNADEPRAVLAELARQTRAATPEDRRAAIASGLWRAQMTAAWGAGLLRETHLLPLIAQRLLASATCFSGQAFCFALARFDTPEAADALQRYLAHYLPVGERDYDQKWAIGALSWLDARHNLSRAATLLDPALWMTTTQGRPLTQLDPAPAIARFHRLMREVESYESSPTP